MADPPSAPPTSPLRERIAEADARASVRRHSEHLEQLAANLRALGLDESVVDQQVIGVFQEYERELERYLERARDRSPADRR
ncbi:hypothetical protein STAQ_49190 [Allostella sp. ATCC 35155]|nr:hypothetical protein STAQ_49190 [Stella sp. ATCC 35155]